MKLNMRLKDLTIVDLDGTLLNYRRRAYNTFCIVSGLEVVKNYRFEDFVSDRFSGLSNYQIYISLSSSPIDMLNFDSQIVDAIEERELLELDELFPDVLPWLNKVGSTSNIIICTSRKNGPNLDWQLNNLKLSHVNCLRVPNAMDKGRAVQALLQGLDVELPKIRFVGDTIHDMKAGKSLGADLYFVERGLNSRDTLYSMSDCSISNTLPLFED